jgi:hypothetical protein
VERTGRLFLAVFSAAVIATSGAMGASAASPAPAPAPVVRVGATNASVGTSASASAASTAAAADAASGPTLGKADGNANGPDPVSHLPGFSHAGAAAAGAGPALGLSKLFRSGASGATKPSTSSTPTTAPATTPTPTPAPSATVTPASVPATSQGGANPATQTNYTLSGTVTNGTNGIGGIQVFLCANGTCQDNQATYGTATTSASGFYSMSVPYDTVGGLWFLDPTGTYGGGWRDMWGGLTVNYANRAGWAILTDTPNMGVTLAPAVHITGKVTTPALAALAGVQVTSHVGTSNSDVYGTVTTDGDGNFSLPATAGGTYRISFVDPAGGYGPSWYTGTGPVYAIGSAGSVPVSGDTTLSDTALPDAVHISGTITGQGAGVLAGIEASTCDYGSWCATSTSGADGTYSLAVAPNSGYHVSFRDPNGVYSDGYLGSAGFSYDTAQYLQVASSGATGEDVTLPLTIHLGGKLENSDGDGVPNQTVGYFSKGPGVLQWVVAATTAADGTFSAAVKPGSYQLIVSPPDTYFSFFSGTIVITGQNKTDLLITLQRYTYYRGTVRNGDGQPLQGIHVDLNSSQWVATGADGTYTILSRAGSNLIRFTDPAATYATGFYSDSGFQYSASLATSVPMGSTDVSGLDVSLPKTVHIYGTVTNLNGTGVESNIWIYVGNAQVGGTLADGSYSVVVAPGALTVGFYDNSGEFKTSWYSVNGAVLDEGEATPVVVGTTDVEVDIALPTVLPQLMGRVTNSLGQGIGGVAVVIGGYSVGSTGPDGRYQASIQSGQYNGQLTQGSYYAYFTDPAFNYAAGYYSSSGFTPDLSSATQVTVGTTDVLHVDIVLPAHPRVSGRVTTPDGMPLVGTIVWAWTDPYSSRLVATTAADGTYSYPEWPGTTETVQFVPPTDTYATGWYSTSGVVFDETQATKLTVTSDITGVDAVLPLQHYIHVTISTTLGVPLSACEVSLYFDGSSVNSWDTDNNGEIVFRVHPGTYLLQVGGGSGGLAYGWYSDSGFVYESGAATPIVVTDHDATVGLVVPWSSYITGTVISAWGPRSWIEVDLYRGGVGYGYTYTNGDGTFEIAVAPGSYTVGFYDPYASCADGWLGASGFTGDPNSAVLVYVGADSVDVGTVTVPLVRNISGKIKASGAAQYAVIVEAFVGNSYYGLVHENSDGTYSIPVPPGNVTLWFYDTSANCAGGWYTPAGPTANWKSATVLNTSASDLTGKNITLPYPAHYITGRVTASDGSSAYDALVEAYSNGGSAGYAWTDGAGSYRIALPSGSYTLRIDGTQHSDQYSSPNLYGAGWYISSGSHFTADPALASAVSLTTSATINVTIPLVTHITGKVTDGNGIGIGRVYAEAIINGSYYGEAVTNSDGTYTLPVAPGTYKMGFFDAYDFYVGGFYSAGGVVTLYSRSTDIVVGSSDVTINARLLAPGVPTKPVGVAALSYDQSASVYWSSPSYDGGSDIIGYTVTASDGTHTCDWTAGPLTCMVTGLTNAQPYTFTVVATNSFGDGPASDPSDPVTPGVGPALNTYHTVDPVRLLDTRIGNGLNGKLTAGAPRTFQITGRGGASNIPAGASAVTANVTIVKPSAASSVYLGPTQIAHPTSATINFNKADITAYGSTISLGSDGSMSVTYMASSGTTDLLVDVTGFFTPDATGNTYHPLTPARLLDSRIGNGQTKKAKLKANVPITFTIRGRGGVPANAVAVTGNVTVVNATNGWAIYVGPDPLIKPPASTMNFAKGQIRANSMTVALSSKGTLSATFLSSSGSTTDLVFDVTGYYTADLSGAKYVPITTPVSILDTRTGIGSSGKIAANTPRTFTVRGSGGVPDTATGITGIVAVYGQTSSWAVFVGPTPTAKPSTSAMNFLKGDNCSNGVTVALSPTGSLSVTFMSGAGNSTNAGIVVTGYFVP